jgi:hypothetical protein
VEIPIVDHQADILTGLDAIVEQVGQREKALRSYLAKLSDCLAAYCSRANLYCPGERFVLEECGDGECVFGYLFCTDAGLSIGSAFSGDLAGQLDGDAVEYSVKTVDEAPLIWLRAICDREVIEGFLAKLEERLLERNEEMRSKVAALEQITFAPPTFAVAEFEQLARELGYGQIVSEWRKAQLTAVSDPESAIRMACVLIESVCKHILKDKKEGRDPKADLPTLFKKIRQVLNIDPSQAGAEPIRNICTGLITVVENIGAFRNGASDAHGRGPIRPTVTPSHAALAVNGAGSVATFLLERWKDVKSGGQSTIIAARDGRLRELAGRSTGHSFHQESDAEVRSGQV